MIAYQSERCTLYHADAIDALAEIAPKSIDLIATDPPYGVKFRSNMGGYGFDAIAGDDGTLDVSGLIEFALRTLRPKRHVYAFGPDVLAPIGKIASSVELIWDKGQVGMGDLSLPFAPQHEHIRFGVYIPSKAEQARYGAGRLAARLRQGSVLRHPRKSGRANNRHPTEKPVALMRQIIEASSLVGETVLDPFAGSGSTLVAAILAGRCAVGIEIDAQYTPTIIERVEAAERLAEQMEKM